MTKKESPIGYPQTKVVDCRLPSDSVRHSVLTLPSSAVCRLPFIWFLFLTLLFSPSLFAEDEYINEWRKWFVPEGKITLLTLEPSLPVPREEFESWIERLEQKSEKQDGKQPFVSKIVLKAKLEGRQLVSGQGSFTLSPRSDRNNSIPLNPFTLAVNSLHWSDNSEAFLFCEPNGENRLLVPAETDSNAYDHLQFHWSLQSRKDNRNEIVFDLMLPPCINSELHLALPESLTLTTSAGLVFPEEKNDTDNIGLRTWRVLLGHHSNTTLTITLDKSLLSAKQKSAIHQTLRYFVSPQRLETELQVVFIDSCPTELLIALETPLRPVDVKYGNRPVAWVQSTVSPEATEIHVDLSPFADEEPEELVVELSGPFLENQRWVLPRVRVTSPDIFWTATRCGVRVLAPLRARNIIAHQAVQVTPSVDTDWAMMERYVFQFFKDDAQIELETVYSTPQITVNSAAQIDWNDNEIGSTVYLDCSVTEGDHFALNFPVSEHWIIDSVTSYPPTNTSSNDGESAFYWDVLEDEQTPKTRTLSVQLNRPLRSRTPVTLQLACRLITSSQTQFRLSELSPIKFARRHGEQHYIGTQFNLTASSIKPSVSASTFTVPYTFFFGGSTLELSGDVYPFNSRTQDIHFELERMRSNYTADISGNIYVDNDYLTSTYHIHCTPVDSSITRIFVHFTPLGHNNSSSNWDWSLIGASDPSHSIRIRQTAPDELKTLLPVSEQQNWSEGLDSGETWEIHFDDLQTTSFEILVESVIPLTDSILIPLASVPFASSQKGELTIESPQQFDYRIISERLDSIPIAPPPWNCYQNVRAAFRYDPQEELHRSQHVPLLLHKRTPDEQIDIAWVWSLRLNSHYEPEGIVRNRALFLVENQGKDVFKITLPRGIDATNVSAVSLDSQQIPWHYDEIQKTINVTLPVGQRFVSISTEYTYQDIPLVQQRKLRPQYPSADVPILSGSWISWFPPEFDVTLRHASADAVQASAKRRSFSKALDYLLAGTYRSFLWSEWDNAFYSGQRRLEAETVAQGFFDAVADVLQNGSISTWGELIENENILSTIRFRLSGVKQPVETKLLIDKQALTFLGITPATPIENVGSIHSGNVREKLFEQSGLVLLIATKTRSDSFKEYRFAFTTPMTLSLNRQFQPAPAGLCVRVVPFDVLDPELPAWLSPIRWLSETTLSSIPWSVSVQAIQGTALTSDWIAYELPLNTEQPLYIAHHKKIAALQWIAFLFVVLITCRKPFSSPVLLMFLLIVFELTARSVPLCYIGIPSGALLGVLVSLAFILIRSQFVINDIPPEYPSKDDSTECSVSFVPTPLTLRSLLLCGLLVGLSASVTAQTSPIQIPDSARKEPYRVFYPTDAEGQITGEKVMIPVEFLKRLNRNVKTEESVRSQRWNITKAVYQGSLVRGTSGQLECSGDFKAIFEVYLHSPSVTITLPDLPAVQGRFYLDSRPIQPIGEDESQSNTLSFSIENETLGKHTLEITLSPKITLRSDGETSQIAFAIPKVLHSTLRLNVPPDISPVTVSNALGVVTTNTVLAPVVTAELGATEQLSLLWIDDPNRGGVLMNEVEQFFRIEPKLTRVVLKVLFRVRTNGRKIQHLTILTDPRWTRSGRFTCVEHQTVPRSETNTDVRSFDSPVDSPYDISTINFLSPVSGPLTLRADFVLREINGNGNGIGNIRLPEFRVPQSQITKSMLAVFADPTLDIDFPAEGRSSDFMSGWQGISDFTAPLWENNSLLGIAEMFIGRDDVSRERPDVEYDLTKTEPNWTLHIQSKKAVSRAGVTQSVQFDANELKVHAVGEFTTDFQVFRQQFSTDRPIQIESIDVRNLQNELVESRYQQIAPKQYLIFFKKPVTKKYTVTVQGIFETMEMPERSPVPVLMFDEVQVTDHSFNFFRTSAVIASLFSSEQSGWSKSSTIPAAPESFSQPIPVGTWQKTKLTESVLPETEVNTELLQFSVSPNRPKIQCKTSLSLDVDSGGRWTMVLDFAGKITGGDIKQLAFQWDERCGIIQSVEPDISRSLEPFGGQQALVLSPSEPMQGEQNIKITVALNTSRTASLPNVFPLARGANQFESEIFIDLPRKQRDEIILWDLNHLDVIEELNTDASRLILKVTDTSFSATVSQAESKLTALFYDIGFLVMRDGTVFGAVTVDLRNQGQDSFILQMPPEYEPIQITAASKILDRTRLDEKHRWRVHIGTSDYPQRFNMLFRASLPQPLKIWKREQIVSAIQFPVLEGVAVQETLWTAAFEGNVPTLNVEFLSEKNEMNDLKNHVPLSGKDVALSSVGVSLIRENNLIHLLRTLPVSTRQEEVQRWFSHWSDEWNTVADKVDYQFARLSSQNVKPQLIVRPHDLNGERTETAGTIRSFWETMGASTHKALRDNKEQSVQEKFGAVMESTPPKTVPNLNSHVYWQGRISDELQYLFGAEEGMIRTVYFTSKPDEKMWTDWFSDHAWIGINVVLLFPIFVLLSVRWVHLMELWLQFPHFWGMTVGVLLWTFVPESFIGVIIIGLTLASLFRPSWTRHRSLSKPF